jgi:hypothetical protein
MLANGRWRLLGFLSLLVVVLAALSPLAMADSKDSTAGPHIQILAPSEGAELSGKTTITIDINGGKGQMVIRRFSTSK